jgi:hypothetical protein
MPVRAVFVQFTNALSIHSGFYKGKTMDDNKKKFIPPLAIDTKYFNGDLSNEPDFGRIHLVGQYH